MEKNDFWEETISRQDIFNGNIINVALDQVRLPNGLQASRELVFHQGAVGILAITPANKIVLVRQFRKPLEKVILEIPAGKIEPDEPDHLLTAQRELEEETGYQGQEFKLLLEFSTAPGFANEILYLYEAKKLIKVDNPLPLDEDEYLEVSHLSLAEAKAAIESGEIYDAKTILAIQFWELKSLKKE